MIYLRKRDAVHRVEWASEKRSGPRVGLVSRVVSLGLGMGWGFGLQCDSCPGVASLSLFVGQWTLQSSKALEKGTLMFPKCIEWSNLQPMTWKLRLETEGFRKSLGTCLGTQGV